MEEEAITSVIGSLWLQKLAWGLKHHQEQNVTKKKHLNALFSLQRKLPEGRLVKTKKSVVSYVHKNFVHLHQSILKENIDLTMQLLISENKQSTSREKKLRCATEIFQIFLSLFFAECISNHHTIDIYHKFFFNVFFNCKKLFLRKLKYNENTISTQCDQSLKKYLRNFAL